MYKLGLLPAVILVALLAAPNALAREWTCTATFFLTDSNQEYTVPPWKMKTGDPHAKFGDREKSCWRYIEAEVLNTQFWSRFRLTPAEQNRICRNRGGQFRIAYGFDERPKQWHELRSISAPPCACEHSCAAGYLLDTTSDPKHERCVRQLCTTTGIADQRLGPHDNGIGISAGSIFHHLPVAVSNCVFGTWTAWLNRDDAGGTGDFETLRDFVNARQVCAQPVAIQCTTLDGRDWRSTGQRYTCDATSGGICRNDGQACANYRVRFVCR